MRVVNMNPKHVFSTKDTLELPNDEFGFLTTVLFNKQCMHPKMRFFCIFNVTYTFLAVTAVFRILII